jgi:hypothetical protein
MPSSKTKPTAGGRSDVVCWRLGWAAQIKLIDHNRSRVSSTRCGPPWPGKFGLSWADCALLQRSTLLIFSVVTRLVEMLETNNGDFLHPRRWLSRFTHAMPSIAWDMPWDWQEVRSWGNLGREIMLRARGWSIWGGRSWPRFVQARQEARPPLGLPRFSVRRR